MSILAVALAAGVAIAVGILLFIQLKGIYKGKTALEEYIGEKKRRREGGGRLEKE